MGVFYFDQTSASAITKERYTKDYVEMLVFKSPAFAMMPKKTDYGGQSFIGATGYAPPASTSPSDATAFTTGGPSQYSQWNCPWVQLFGSANVTGFAIDATKGDENAIVDVIVRESDNAYESLGQDLGYGIWSNGGGARGKLSAGTVAGTGPFTLLNPNDIVKFMAGMIVNAATTDGTSGAVETGSAIIQSVDVNAGTFTTTANLSTGIPTVSNTDFLFSQGSFGATMKGVPAWIPDVNHRPTGGDSFNGVNRFNTDPARLAGIYYNGGGGPKEESLFQAMILSNRLGGKPDKCFLNPVDYSDVVKGLQSRSIYAITGTAFGSPTIGFDGVKVVTPGGTLEIYEDPYVPSGDGYLLQMNTWLIPSMGPVPKVLDEVDGITWLRQAGLDAYQMRIGARFTTYCKSPGSNAVVTF
jgi:hypothetical protein